MNVKTRIVKLLLVAATTATAYAQQAPSVATDQQIPEPQQVIKNYAATALNPVPSSNVAINSYATEDWTPDSSWGSVVKKGSVSGAGCDSAISNALFSQQLAEIAGAKKQAAETIQQPPDNAFTGLLNSGCIPGLGASLSFPSLAGLANIPSMLAQRVCNAARNVEQNYVSQYIDNPISGLTKNANINLGSIGGYSLGSVPVGVQFSANGTTGGSGGVSFDTNAVQTAQNLGSDVEGQIQNITGVRGNGGSGGLSANSLAGSSFLNSIR